MTDVRKHLGDRIRLYRGRLELSQEALANAIGVSKQTVYRLENGQVWPEYDNLKALSDRLSMTPAQLLGIGDPTPEQALEVLAKAISSKPPSILPETDDFNAEEITMLREAVIAIREARSIGDTRKKREQNS